MQGEPAFNGAAPVKVRNLHCQQIRKVPVAAFNGAAPVKVRNPVERREHRVARNPFNGAAPVKVRNRQYGLALPCAWSNPSMGPHP